MNDLIEKIASIVKEASKIMMDSEARSGINQKGNSSNFVTDSDLKIQEFLSQKLTLLLPGSTIIGEEKDQTDSSGEYV